MSEASIGIAIFIGISIFSAIIFHIFIKRYMIASLIAAFCASILFQIIVSIHLGYIDPLAVIGLLVGGIIAFTVSVICGFPFWKARHIRK